MENAMNESMKKAALGALILCMGALALGGCVYDGPYGEHYGRDWRHSRYYGHDRYRHDYDRGDYDRDGD
jgi:hypothetical protein